MNSSAVNNNFDIRDHLEKLVPSKDGKFECPVCGKGNLSVDKKTGKFQCWNCGDTRAIAKNLTQNDRLYEVKNTNQTPKKPKIELARLEPKPGNNLPDSGGKTHYYYGEELRVVRTDREKGKKIYPQYFNGSWVSRKGDRDCPDRDWPLYRQEDVTDVTGKWVVLVEGEKCTDFMRSHTGLVTVTAQGSEWTDKHIERHLKKLRGMGVEGIVVWPDHDDVGYKKAGLIKEVGTRVGLKISVLSPLELDSKIEDNDDVVDVVRRTGMDGNQLVELIYQQINQQVNQQVNQQTNTKPVRETIPDSLPSTESKTFCQVVTDALYSDTSHPYICVGGRLYRWNGNHYEYSTDGDERRRITDFCDTYSVSTLSKTNQVKVTHPYASTPKINEALEWVKNKFYVNPDQINPAGLNCKNGFLEIIWNSEIPSWKLKPHTPDIFVTYPGLIEFDPSADTRDCDRLLAALDPQPRDIFLKVVAASLDLKKVRALRGRSVRSLFLQGTGSNGKDALREAVSTIFGHFGLTSISVSDFRQYDEGRRFPLANLVNSRVNWSSENASFSLERLESLKAAITGQELVCEQKGKDGQPFHPKSVFLFNCNDIPRVVGSLDAIATRFGFLKFEKTFKINADPTKGEVEADPRFVYDPDFLINNVSPALLNRLLDALVSLVSDGIDYSPLESTMDSIQSQNSHLWSFIRETGLGYGDGSLTASELWEPLRDWYLANGTLEIDDSGTKPKNIWNDQSNPLDKNVKAVNQVLERFLKYFPKAKIGTTYDQVKRKSIPVLMGVNFMSNESTATAVATAATAVARQLHRQQTLTQQGCSVTDPNFPTAIENQEIVETPDSGSKSLTENKDLVEKLPSVTAQPYTVGVTAVATAVATASQLPEQTQNPHPKKRATKIAWEPYFDTLLRVKIKIGGKDGDELVQASKEDLDNGSTRFILVPAFKENLGNGSTRFIYEKDGEWYEIVK